MERLMPAAFEAAARFVEDTARPLDRALFAFWFRGGSAERVAGELSRFQN